MNLQMKLSKRAKIPIDTQVSVFFRDGWVCRWCDSPTIFAPSLKYIQKLTVHSKSEHKLAYYDLHYRRDRAPLLDLLAATIDHVVPFSRGGNDTVENFVTA